MFKKVMPLFLVVVIMVSIVAMPVSAYVPGDPIDYNDYVTDFTVDGDNDTVTVVFPSSLSSWMDKDLNVFGYGYEDFTIYYSDQGVDRGNLFYNYIADRLDLTNVPNKSLLSFYFKLDNSPIYPIVRIKMHYADVNGVFIGQQILFSHVAEETEEPMTYFEVQATRELVKPDGAVSAAIQVEIKDFYPSGAVYFCFAPLKLEMSIPSMIRLQEQTGKTNELLEDMVEQEKISQEKMDEMIEQEKANGEKLDDVIEQEKENGEKLDDIQDTIEKQPEQEKNEALSGGDKNVGEILEIIPDESDGFVNALGEFTAAMSYNGTSAVLPIPAVVLPGIDGLFPETVLLDAQEFDFGVYIQMMPDWLLLLVQSLLTIALIVYCFKELYDTISYVMTLRRGA